MLLGIICCVCGAGAAGYAGYLDFSAAQGKAYTGVAGNSTVWLAVAVSLNIAGVAILFNLTSG